MNNQQLTEKLITVREKYPQLATRYERGIGIYKMNGIKSIDETRFVVSSATKDDRVYLVEVVSGARFCTCEDFRNKAPQIGNQKFCKHIIAAVLWKLHGKLEEVQS